MAEKDKTPPSIGRGGRGHLILKALKATEKPGTRTEDSSSSQEGASSGYESKSKGSSAHLSFETSSKSKGTGGRGIMLSRYIQQQQQAKTNLESVTPSVGRGIMGRGGALLQAAESARSEGFSSAHSDMKSLSERVSNITLSSEDESPTIRLGSSGVKFQAVSNWIRLDLEPGMAVYEYEVIFDPPVDSKSLRFQLLNSQRDKIGNTKSFDGSKLWLPIVLPKENFEGVEDGDGWEKLFFPFLFSPSASTSVSNFDFRLEIWPGYVTAAHHTEGGVMLCVDVSHRVLRTTTVYKIMAQLVQSQRANFQQAAISAIVGSIVLTRYNNKCYRIDDIIFDGNPLSTFKSSKGEEISYMDYYKKAYNIQINDPNQPLLLHKLKKKEQKDLGELKMICLIPELCYMTGLTDEMRSDFRVMKDLAQHTRLTPNARQANLRKFIRNVNETPEAKQILADWGLSLNDDTVQVDGRIVPSETIIFKSRQVEGTSIADWGRDSCREKVITPIDLKAGLWLLIHTGRDEAKARNFLENFRQVTIAMGIFVGDPKMLRISSDSTDAYISCLKQNFHDKLQLAVIIFPMAREDRYSAVKRLCCAEFGLPTQCINVRTISAEQKLRSVTQKIALQINCKLGGELWALKIPMTGLMVCGMDVYHDPIRRGNSVVGFVGSLNDSLTRWYSQVMFQKPGEEIVNGMKVALLESLRKYYEENHCLPRSIVIYRDGVADGMLNLTKEHEVPQMTSIFSNFENYNPKFYFVVVQKRINTRIFASLSGRGMENPPPGSIVDHTITKRQWYDFLLISQHVRQGTVSPTHYIVVQDAEGLKPEHMQRLTYKLTHLYYNWPGTVRVPAPCQYSHKLAYLIGQNVRKEPHRKLLDKLYYL